MTNALSGESMGQTSASRLPRPVEVRQLRAGELDDDEVLGARGLDDVHRGDDRGAVAALLMSIAGA
jgi:hypothetical protein